MSSDTIACLQFVVYAFSLLMICIGIMLVYMMFTEDTEVLIDDIKTFKEMMEE